MKFYVTSDIHQKYRLWTNNTAVTGDSEAMLDYISSILDPNEENILLDCGDLFDSRLPSSNDVDVVSRFCSHFKAVYACQGNHDKASPPWGMVARDNVIYPGTSGSICGHLKIFSVDFTSDPEDLRSQLMDCKSNGSAGKRNILLLHQAIDTFFDCRGAADLAEKELVELFGSSWTILCGHIHIHALAGNDAVQILSPGPVVPQDIDQALKYKQYIHRLCLHGESAVLEPIELPVRQFYRLDGSTPGFDINQALASLELPEKTLPGMTPVVMVYQNPDQDRPAYDKAYNEKFIILWRRHELVKEAAEHTIKTCSIEEAVEEEIQQTEKDNAEILSSFTKNLMTAADPLEYVESALTKWEVIRSVKVK